MSEAEVRELPPEQKFFARLSVAKNAEDLDDEWWTLQMLGLEE